MNLKKFSWDDGRALAALLGKFRPDLVDYLSLCAVDDPNAVLEVNCLKSLRSS